MNQGSETSEASETGEIRPVTPPEQSEARRDEAADVGKGAEGAEGASPDSPRRADLNLLQVVSSVLAAGLGVQSSRNRQRDFKQGRAGAFILAGLLFTALFIGGVYTVVSLVLAAR